MTDPDEIAVMHILRGHVRERGNPVRISNQALGLAARVLGCRLYRTLDRQEARGAIRVTGETVDRRIEVMG